MNYEQFLPKNHKRVKAAKSKLEDAESKLKKLHRQQKKNEERLPELEEIFIDAKVIAGTGNCNDADIQDAQQAHQEAKAQANKLKDDISIQQRVVSRLEIKFENTKSDVTAELTDRAMTARDKKIKKEMVKAFNNFAKISNEVAQFEKKLKPKINIGQVAVSEKELWAHQRNYVRRFIDYCKKNGYSLFDE